MRTLLALVTVVLVGLAPAASATELGELLEDGRAASYSAEQIISCATPDGIRESLVTITQTEGELRAKTSVGDGAEVTAGDGGWALTRSGGLVAEAAVDSGTEKGQALYEVQDDRSLEYLGRDAMAYRLLREGVLRAELIVDLESGAMVQAVTYGSDGQVYCERRFVSLEPGVTTLEAKPVGTSEVTPPIWVDDSDLPGDVAGFERLDLYEDVDGLRFAYYSDGFFSFGLFETPTKVAVPDSTSVQLTSGIYDRLFSAGQVTYAWETRTGGLALVGDLPPDLHEAVLSEMPRPEDPGMFRRWWRALFG